MKRQYRQTSLIAALLLSANFAFANTAAEQVGGDDTAEYSYFIVNQDVTAFFRDFARDTRIRFQPSAKTRGRLQTAELVGTVDDIMSEVTTSLDLDWFAHNSVIFVSNKSEVLTRMIRLGDLGYQDALDELEKSGLLFEEFPITTAAENTALMVTGPPRFIALVEGVIEGIPTEVAVAATRRPRTIMVRRGTEVSSEVIR